jgi:DNA-binding GntR family transcriptional regulator
MLPWLSPAPADRIQELRQTSLAKLVRDDVLARILRGELRPGERINEPDVSSRLQVSRVPVREALRELESSGLIVARKHMGVFVRQLDANEVRDLYEMRALLDGFAGAKVAALPDERRHAVVGELEASIRRMNEAADADDVQSYYAENLRFHWCIVDAAGNQPMQDSYRGVVQKLHLARLKNLSRDFGIRISIAEHGEIASSLRAADVTAAQSLLGRHVSDAFRRLQQGVAP